MDRLPPPGSKSGVNSSEPLQEASGTSSKIRVLDPGKGELHDLPPSDTQEIPPQERTIELYSRSLYDRYRAQCLKMYDPELLRKEESEIPEIFTKPKEFEYSETDVDDMVMIDFIENESSIEKTDTASDADETTDTSTPTPEPAHTEETDAATGADETTDMSDDKLQTESPEPAPMEEADETRDAALEEATQSPEKAGKYVQTIADENLQLDKLINVIRSMPSQKRASYFVAIFEGKGANDKERVKAWGEFALSHAWNHKRTDYGNKATAENTMKRKAIKNDLSSLSYLIKQYRGTYRRVKVEHLTDFLDIISAKMQQE